MSRGNILLIDDEDNLRQLLRRVISLEGFVVFEADGLRSGLRQLEKEPVQVILCDVQLPDGNGIDFIPQIKADYPLVEMIMLTAHGNIPAGVKAIQQGAFDYLIKGDDNDRLIPLLDRAMQKTGLQKRVSQLEEQVKKQFSFDTILGSSPLIQAAISLAERVAPTEATVLLLGETGTGKEVFAQAIHQGSRRRSHPFVALNVSSFGKELLESELLGHVAGAFTSAVKDKKGLIEEAHGGTLFLDEIGEMAFELQAKLLRVLETSEFMKVGGTKPIRVSVRIIAATNKDLEKAVMEGRFREDLFYRLNTITITLPALRERKEDIPVLVQHFLQVYAAKTNQRKNSASPEFLDRLQRHDWRGNIRELKNVIERAVILSNTSQLIPSDLPLDFAFSQPKSEGWPTFELASMEKLHIQRVLHHTKGNKVAAAKLLNIGLTTLYRKIEEYQIPHNG